MLNSMIKPVHAPQIASTHCKWPTPSIICWHPKTGVCVSLSEWLMASFSPICFCPVIVTCSPCCSHVARVSPEESRKTLGGVWGYLLALENTAWFLCSRKEIIVQPCVVTCLYFWADTKAPSLPSPHTTPLLTALISPDFGSSHWSVVGFSWVTMAQVILCVPIVKSILLWLAHTVAGFLLSSITCEFMGTKWVWEVCEGEEIT